MPNVDDIIKDIRIGNGMGLKDSLRSTSVTKVFEVFTRNKRWVTTNTAPDLEKLRQKVKEIYPDANFSNETLSYSVRQLKTKGFLHSTRVAEGLHFYGFKEAIEELNNAVNEVINFMRGDSHAS